jgi:predicted PurR-regulated permease PerM
MNKDVSLKSLNFLPLIRRFYSKYQRHAVFGALILVLLVYVLVVLRINSLANAEPSSDQEQVVNNSIPKIDGKQITQIQNLENNNADVHALFNQARNNPFAE